MSRTANSPNTAGAPETTMNATKPRAMQAGHQATWPPVKPANGQAPRNHANPPQALATDPDRRYNADTFCETEAA